MPVLAQAIACTLHEMCQKMFMHRDLRNIVLERLCLAHHKVCHLLCNTGTSQEKPNLIGEALDALGRQVSRMKLQGDKLDARVESCTFIVQTPLP